MNDESSSKYKQFMKCSYFAFFTVVIILSVLLWQFPIVHAESITSGGVTYDNDSSNMESLVQYFELFVDDGVSLLNQEDSGFEYNQPNIDSDGMGTSPFSALPNGLFEKQFVDDNYPSSNFSQNSNFLTCPKIFSISGTQYNLSDFSYCMILGLSYQWDRGYRVVLGSSPDSLVYWMGGAGLSGFRVSGYDDYIYLDFNTSGGLVNGGIQYLENGAVWVSNYYYHPIIGNGDIMSNYYYRQPYNHGYVTYLAMKDGSTDYDNPQARETININYLSLSDSEYDDGSGGDITNNMFLRTADWQFNIPKYATSSSGNLTTYDPCVSNWGQGNVIFTGLLNDFQKDHKNDYKLKFDFYIQFKTKRTNTVHADVNESINRSYAWRNVEVDLSDFIDNNCVNTWVVSDIFTHAEDNNGQSMTSYLSWFLSEYDNQSEFSNTTWTLDCSAHLISGNYTSGALQEQYSFITQVSKEKSNTITENHNPITDDDGNTKYDPQDKDDDSSSVKYKDGSIILTNNDNDSNHQVVNIDNGHDDIIEVLVDKMVPDNANSNGGLTQSFMDMTNSNQWFTVMAAAMPYVPQTFWNAMYSMLTICVGIIGIAFVFWVICHIL